MAEIKNDPLVISAEQDQKHSQSHVHPTERKASVEKQAEFDVEKARGMESEVEKGTNSSSDRDIEREGKNEWTSVSFLYRRFRPLVHLFLACLFTG